MRKGFWKGLRVTEISIMLLVFIIAIYLVYAHRDSFMCRSIESEAKFALQEIYAAQMLYHKQHDHFATLDVLLNQDKRVVLPQKYYSYADAVGPENDKFWIRAFGKPGTLVEGQAWQIDATKALVNIQPRCGHE